MMFFSRDNPFKTINSGAYVINLDKYADAGLLYFVEKLKLFILVLTMFLKKLKNSLEIKT